MKLDLEANGLHSLVEALKAFRMFHEHPSDPNSVLALKDTILRTHHALETLFKGKLMQYNSALLLEDNFKIESFVKNYGRLLNGGLENELDDVRTINLKEAVQRLRDFGLIKADDRNYALFYDNVEKLDRYRNRLQHLSLSADPDVIARMIGIVIPRAIDILDSIPTHHPILGDVRTGRPILDVLKEVL